MKADGLILGSKEDQLVSVQCSAALAHAYKWPIETHSWAGHDLVLDDPEWALERIKKHLS